MRNLVLESVMDYSKDVDQFDDICWSLFHIGAVQEPGRDLGVHGDEGFLKQLVAASEVPVKGRFGVPEHLGDPADGHVLNAVLRCQIDSAVYESLSGIDCSRHGVTSSDSKTTRDDDAHP